MSWLLLWRCIPYSIPNSVPDKWQTAPVKSGSHLEHSQQGLGEVVESASFGHSFVKIKLSPEKLHAQQGKDDNEEEEQQQQRGDGLHGIQQGGHQVAERRPMSAEGENRSCDLVTETSSNHQCGILADPGRLTASLWRSAGDVRSGRQRYRAGTWWRAPPGWSPRCRRTPRNSQSD